jgi:hypothetical protein
MKTPAARVWMLIAVIAALVLSLAVGNHFYSPQGTGSWLVPWWALAAGVAVAEIAPVHLSIRRHTWSASLVEVPLVIGLTLSSPNAAEAHLQRNPLHARIERSGHCLRRRRP